jgi:glyceraldehyde-3-phosphate dehydrogenase (NADP+)
MPRKQDFLIGKQWRSGDRYFTVTNPASGEPLAEVALAGPGDIEEAIVLAERGFTTTRKLPAYMRSRICAQIARGIEARAEEFARTIALESGKPMIFARAEVARSVSTFNIAAEEALRLQGEVLTLDITPAARGKAGITCRFPIGPVAGISPFNFPLNLVAHKVAPAMAAGNPIVLKPSSTTPLTALLLGEVVAATEAPEGGLSVLPTSREDAAPLTEDPRFKMITFTGSAEIGWDIKRRAGKKKVVLELGGNAGVIVEPDADLAFAAKRTVFGAFAYSGQVCISVQRAFVHESVFSRFVDMLKHEAETLVIGDPLDDAVNFGPMIDGKNAQRIESWIANARTGGARVVTGGKRNGNLVPPTILTGVAPGAELACNEAFGPVLAVEPYADFDEAVRRMNDSDFGLQAGVFTQRMDLSLRAFNELEVGGVVLNDVPTFRVDNMPYGGVKDSGFGREGIRYSLEEMTEIKLLVFNHERER